MTIGYLHKCGWFCCFVTDSHKTAIITGGGTTVESYMQDILSILEAAEKERLDCVTFPNKAWNSKNTTSEIIKEMESNHLITIDRAEDSSLKGITIASTGIRVLRTLKNDTAIKKILTQMKNEGAHPSVSYIAKEARRLSQILDD